MSLSENLYNLGALMKTNLEEKGIDGLTGNEGLTTLANKILDISSGSCDSLTLIGLPQIIQKDETSHIGAKLIVSGSPVVNETIYFNIKPPEKYCADYNSFSQLFTENSLGGRGYKSKDKIIQFTASGDTEISFISETMGNPYLTQALGKGEYIITFYDSPFQLFEVINGEAVYINSISTPSGDVWFDFEKNSSNDNVTNIRIRERITITSAETDKNGIATIPYVGTGKGMMTVEAHYYKNGGIFLQETYEVWDTLKFDNGTSTSHNDIWSDNTEALTRASEYSTLKEGGSSNVILGLTIPSSNIRIEFDLYQADGGNTDFFYQFNQSGAYKNGGSVDHLGKSLNQWNHIVIDLPSSSGYHLLSDGVNTPVQRSMTWDTTSNILFRLWTAGNMTELRFKNFKVYPI